MELTTVRLPTSIKEKLKIIASEQGITTSQYLRRLIEQHVSSQASPTQTNSTASSESPLSSAGQKWRKTHVLSLLEIRFLMRFLVARQLPEESKIMLEKAQRAAKDYWQEMEDA